MNVQRTEAEKEALRERRYRRTLAGMGLALRKSRARYQKPGDMLGFMIIDGRSNSVVYGQDFDLGLDDVERFIRERAQPEQP